MGRGSISDRTDRGRGFEARWYTIDTDGKRTQHSKTCESYRAAERYLNMVLGEEARGESHDPRRGKTSFEAVANSWLQTLTNVKPRTRVGYESILHEHLLPAFRFFPIDAIKPGDIHRFLSSREVSPGTKRNIIRVLSPIMNLAVLDGRIRTNPVATLLKTFKLPKTPRNDELAVLTAQQVQELAEEVGPKYRALILTAAYTGLRAGELSALRVKDLDLNDKRLRIRESVSDVNGNLQFVAPKNGKTRSVSLPAFLLDVLAERQEGRGHEYFVFGGSKPMRHGNFYSRHFRPAVERLVESGRWPDRFSKFRFHDLRHTAASLLIDLGVHPKAVQERLGHSSINITMDTYGHLYKGRDAEVADRLEEAYLASFEAAG